MKADRATETAGDGKRKGRVPWCETKEFRQIRAEEMRRGLKPIRSANLDLGRTVPLETIMKSRMRPAGVSAVRWRIELSRRRMWCGRDGMVEFARDPDRM